MRVQRHEDDDSDFDSDFDFDFDFDFDSDFQATGVLPQGQLPALSMDFAAQLLSAGQCHLAVYVMHHMATSAEHPEAVQRAIRSVLDLYCPLWVESREQRAFLEGFLKVPPHWLAASEVMMTSRTADSWRYFAHFFLLFT